MLRIFTTPEGETISVNHIISITRIRRLQFAIRDLYYFDIKTAVGTYRINGKVNQITELRTSLEVEIGRGTQTKSLTNNGK